MSDRIFEPTIDFYDVFTDITDEDREAWERAAAFCKEVKPVCAQNWSDHNYDTSLLKKAAEYDLFPLDMEIPGHKSTTAMGANLIALEISRMDGSVGTALAVQSGLAMRSIYELGSEEQKAEYLPKMAKADLFGAFALTEPLHGSDSVGLETSAVRDGDDWVINGEKKWIGNGAAGGISVVWARNEDGDVNGFIVPQETEGYNAEVIKGKAALRAIDQAHIVFNDVRVPEANRLPKATSFRATAGVLEGTRFSVAWGALGAAMNCYEIALQYAQDRIQFGRPLSHAQVIQQRLADMQQELVSLALYCRHLQTLADRGTQTPAQASLAKVHATRTLRSVSANARDMLGGVGILLENDIIRHFADAEALHTYEGTDTIQSLIVGKALVGKSAWK